MDHPPRPDAPLRRFTIGDFLVLTLVVAGACLAARTNLPDAVELGRVLRPAALLDPEAWVDPARDEPHIRSQLRSTALLMTASVQGTVGVPYPLIWAAVPKKGKALVALRQCVVLTFPILAYLSYALLLLRLVRPRPGWREILRQPGCSACLAISLGLPVITWVEQVTLVPIPLWSVAGAVGAAWLIQVLALRWRPEPSWVDRTGRALGLCWLLVGGIAAI